MSRTKMSIGQDHVTMTYPSGAVKVAKILITELDADGEPVRIVLDRVVVTSIQTIPGWSSWGVFATELIRDPQVY